MRQSESYYEKKLKEMSDRLEKIQAYQTYIEEKIMKNSEIATPGGKRDFSTSRRTD